MNKKISFGIFFFLLLFLLITLTACKETTHRIVQFQTSDGVNIVGNFYDANSNRAVILLHMLNSNKESWESFALQLKKEGYSVLEIDMRGHGLSNIQNGVIISWRQFSQEGFNDMVLDVDAAINFLKENGIEEDKIILGGASIGANIALKACVRHPEIPAAFLLSPGMDYKGINIKSDLDKINASLLLFASELDTSSYKSTEEISSILTERNLDSRKISFEGTAHGTDMFRLKYGPSEEILHWLEVLEI